MTRTRSNEFESSNEFPYDDDDTADAGNDAGPRVMDDESSRTHPNNKEEGPACMACRRKKAKCSREQPCSHCVKHRRDCVYDGVKNKPGMRSGAIEQLTQRLDKLENMFLGQSLVWQQVWKHLESVNAGTTTAHPAVPSGPDTGESPPIFAARTPSASLRDTISGLGRSLGSIGNVSSTGVRPDTANLFDPSRPAKRTRLSNGRTAAARPSRAPSLPLPDDLVDALVDVYFERVHPWIPMLHVVRFRQDLTDPTKRPGLSTILHAITSICLRFSHDPRVADTAVQRSISKRCREKVILESMEVFSVTNLQALIICAFDTIASGRGPSSWSIVGSMTRTVEQLQLGVEEEDQLDPTMSSGGMLSRITFLPASKDWCQQEERRRVFWTVMLMDRFCSISTGWNLSLTNADARRRLPCEGGLWEAGEALPYPTPHFGVSDQSAATADGPLPGQTADGQGQEFLGGFAYAIEATENLSLITSFCLQQPVDVSRPQKAQMWLMKFKQLDLRLIQWKLFLPERWREACPVNADGNMDPNLTLAHITHNTAVALLHQAMAYPSPIWQLTSVRLPSSSSAETCMAAAIEVSTIADHFLRNSNFLANHQFAFCLFVCGRILLANANYLQTPLEGQPFDSLVYSLREMAARWDGKPAGGSSAGPPRSSSLAAKFASRLQGARELGSTTYDIRQAAFSEQIDDSSRGAEACYDMPQENAGAEHARLARELGEGSVGWSPSRMSASGPSEGSASENLTLAFPPLPQALQPHSGMQRLYCSADMPVQPDDGTMANDPSKTPAEGGDEQPEGVPDADDIYAYLNGAFLPEQRISIYSQQNQRPNQGPVPSYHLP